MNNSLFMIIIFWGVWIIIPVLFDGVLAFFYMAVIILNKKYKKMKHTKVCSTGVVEQASACGDSQTLDPAQLPRVSIIIPTYNEEENINQCLDYLKSQTYPQDKIEIIVVDNGSTDETSSIVKEHLKEIWEKQHVIASPAESGINSAKQSDLSFRTGGKPDPESRQDWIPGQARDDTPCQIAASPRQDGASRNDNGPSTPLGVNFGGILRLLIRYEKGKAKALNTGIKLAHGEIIINIDCRSFLAPEAIYNMVKKFIKEPEYGAITGNIEIDWRLIYERDLDGNYLLDSNGNYRPRDLSHKEKFLGKSQFMEYLTSFRLGREFQDITGSMYTFSGAFSAFRREVLLNSPLYQSRTVAEDTDLTLDLQGQNIRLGFAKEAKAYLKPVISFEKFYAQRIRWHRGQIEVIGLHLDWYANLRKGFWRNIWLGFLLMIDHTFSFPRIIWIFMLPLFFLFGYSMSLIIEAIFIMYTFYVLMDFLNAYYCYNVTDAETRIKIKDSIQYCLVTPFFRILTFYFRFAGYLETLKEPQAWTTPINPVRSVKVYRSSLKGSYQKTTNFGLKVWQFISRQKAEAPVYYDEKIAELDDYGLKQIEIQTDPKAVGGEVVYVQKKMDGIHSSYDYKER